MKHFLLPLILMNLPNIILTQNNQSIPELYTIYKNALNRCNTCMEDAIYGSDMNNYNIALSDILRDIKNSKEGDKYPFLHKALFIRIAQDRVHLGSREYANQLTRMDSARALRTLLTPLIEKRRAMPKDVSAGYTDFKEEFDKLKKKEKEKILAVFGMSDDSKSQFEQAAWKQITAYTDSIRREKEILLYSALVNEPTIQKLEDFIEFSPYDGTIKDYNRNAEDAFLRLFKLYTADGENSSVTDFNTLITEAAGGGFYSIWKELPKNEQFKKIAKAQADSATAWQRIIYGRVQTKEKLLRLAYSAFRHEIGFVAFQKWAWSYLMSGKFDTIHVVINDLQEKLNTERDLKFNFDKLEKYRQVITLIEGDDNFFKRKVEPLEAGNTAGNEVYFFLNKQSSHLAIVPQGNGYIKRFSIDKKKMDLSASGPDVEAVPYSYVHWFANLKSYPESLANPRHSDFKIDNNLIINASDFFLSADENILLFVGITKTPGKETLNDKFYPYPNKSCGIQGFQESKSTPKPYHGKAAGTPNTDIYYSVKTKGQWSTPKLIPGCINTPYSERSPTLSLDGSTLYFASEGHPGLGGYDLFSITLNADFTSSGEPENAYAVNSNYDEMFYNELSFNKDVVFITSNRGKNRDFDLYKVMFKEVVKEVVKDTIPKDTLVKIKYPPKDDTRTLIIEDPECIKRDAPTPGWPDGFVMILGKVYDSKREPVKNVQVYFYDRAGKVYKDSVTNGNEYNCEVPIGMREFKMVANVFTDDGKLIKYQAQEFIDLEKCLKYAINKDEPIHIYKDIVTKDIKGYTEFEMPFFFDTNVSDYSVSSENLMAQYYIDMFRDLSTSPTVQILCEGFADERGSYEYNRVLSEKRAKYVRDFLVTKANFPPHRIKFEGASETKKYDGDNFDKYVKNLAFPLVFLELEEKKLLLNRRVVVKFKY